jgi:hypothetical protein
VDGATAELTPLPGFGTQRPPTIDFLVVKERLAEFRTDPSIGTAADALAAGFVLGASNLVQQPAEFMVARAAEVGAPALVLARRVLGLKPATPDSQASAEPCGRAVSLKESRRLGPCGAARLYGAALGGE